MLTSSKNDLLSFAFIFYFNPLIFRSDCMNAFSSMLVPGFIMTCYPCEEKNPPMLLFSALVGTYRYYCPTGSSTSLVCSAGHFCPRGSVSQHSCPSGQYQPNPGYSYCFRCPGGQYQEDHGQMSCKNCPKVRVFAQFSFCFCLHAMVRHTLL